MPPATPTTLPTPTSPPPTESVSLPGCTVISPLPTPGPTEASRFAPVSDADWILGPSDAVITLLEYCDFQTPGCTSMAITMVLLIDEFPGEVRVVYRHFPLMSVHDKAALAMQAAEAAGAQGKFWQIHDLLYGRQAEWVDLSVEDFQTWITTRAKELGLDVEAFSQAMLSEQAAAEAQAAWESGVETGMFATPFLLVNGDIWPDGLPMSKSSIASVIRLDLLEERQFTECPPMTIDASRQYIATLHTEKGDIVIELFPDKAPWAVNNFIFLARNGWYDGVTFHRVLEGFVAQAGDPSGTGYGTPGYAFSNEISDLKFDRAGLVAMANAGPDSNGSQFFITFAPVPDLDGGYTIFGQVIEGMDVALSLKPRDPSKGLDLTPGDAILSVEIEEK
jgi:cyclophilin family peptidyl-prolyl cis-trans isomerase/protein-disulfide isomerase